MPDECVILADGPGALVELCGISTLERLLRTLQRCGITRATVLSSTSERIAEELNQPSWARAQLNVAIAKRTEGVISAEQVVAVWPKGTQLLLLVRADAVFDLLLLQALSTHTGAAALVDSSPPPQLQPLIASASNISRGKLCGAS